MLIWPVLKIIHSHSFHSFTVKSNPHLFSILDGEQEDVLQEFRGRTWEREMAKDPAEWDNLRSQFTFLCTLSYSQIIWWKFGEYKIGSWAISNPKRWCCDSAALNTPANLENSAEATRLEKVTVDSHPKGRQCQRMLKLPHDCTHLIC